MSCFCTTTTTTMMYYYHHYHPAREQQGLIAQTFSRQSGYRPVAPAETPSPPPTIPHHRAPQAAKMHSCTMQALSQHPPQRIYTTPHAVLVLVLVAVCGRSRRQEQRHEGRRRFDRVNNPRFLRSMSRQRRRAIGASPTGFFSSHSLQTRHVHDGGDCGIGEEPFGELKA